jgi:chorismate-pyruvate lyase
MNTHRLVTGAGVSWLVRLALVVSVWSGAATHGLAQGVAWPDTLESRLEIESLLQTLNAAILASPSATQSLEQWCRDHRMADDPALVAHVINGVSKTPTADQLQRLQVTDSREVTYRRVELRCGSHVLSEADNWYVPGRLTAEMNRLLETSETPFGRAVQPLHPYRRTFAVRFLWSPLPPGWEQPRQPDARMRQSAAALMLPTDLFEHRAILYTSDNQPFSEVDEVYKGQILDFDRAR